MNNLLILKFENISYLHRETIHAYTSHASRTLFTKFSPSFSTTFPKFTKGINTELSLPIICNLIVESQQKRNYLIPFKFIEP